MIDLQRLLKSPSLPTEFTLAGSKQDDNNDGMFQIDRKSGMSVISQCTIFSDGLSNFLVFCAMYVVRLSQSETDVLKTKICRIK